MIEKVINRKNMLRAYRQVVSNKGSAGVDGMPVKALWEHLDKNREKIALEVCNGTYLPQAKPVPSEIDGLELKDKFNRPNKNADKCYCRK